MYLLAVPVCLTALPVGRWLSGRIRPARFELFTFVVLLERGCCWTWVMNYLASFNRGTLADRGLSIVAL